MVFTPAMSETLPRRFGLLQATALNMSNMIGIGPFITIPLLMSSLGGPQALLGWLIAVIVTIPDGLVWSELAPPCPVPAVATFTCVRLTADNGTAG